MAGGRRAGWRTDRGSKRRIARLDRGIWQTRDTWLVIALGVAILLIYFALVECECA
jgi:hypothetical protein